MTSILKCSSTRMYNLLDHSIAGEVVLLPSWPWESYRWLSAKKDVTPLLTHWSYVFLALSHRYYDLPSCVSMAVVPYDLSWYRLVLVVFYTQALRGYQGRTQNSIHQKQHSPIVHLLRWSLTKTSEDASVYNMITWMFFFKMTSTVIIIELPACWSLLYTKCG